MTHDRLRWTLAATFETGLSGDPVANTQSLLRRRVFVVTDVAAALTTSPLGRRRCFLQSPSTTSLSTSSLQATHDETISGYGKMCVLKMTWPIDATKKR